MNAIADMAPTWRALADPTRRAILDHLRSGPRTTGDLCAQFPLSRFAVMKHLTVLVEAELVLVRREGRERWNYLNAVPLQQISERWLGKYERHWAGSLLRLKERAESPGGDLDMPSTLDPTHTLRTIRIEQEVEIAAAPDAVFDAMTGDVSSWWGAPYLLSADDAKAVVIEQKVGGRMYEDWGNGDGGWWADVTELKRGRKIELTGRMGMRGAYNGVIVLELEPSGAGTRLKMSHRAVGELSSETEQGYTGGWNDLLATRLKNFVERGTKSGVAA